jgi:glycosyltransferase involved in cell wall biosynthesis
MSAIYVEGESTNNCPLVSIIMNCYNGEKYLRDAIDSVYQQSYQNWEIIFWDNASIDNSAEVALSYDGRLKYFKSKATTTLGEARVLAVDKVQGKYIAFLDCDDIWYPEKLAQQVDVINNYNDIGFVYCKTNTIIEESHSILKAGDSVLPSGYIFNSLVKSNFIPFVSAFMSIKVYNECGGFPENYKNSTDYCLFLKIAKKYKIFAIQDTCCAYRIHSDNLSHKQRIIGAQESIDAISRFLPDKMAANGMKYQYADLAIMYLKEMRFIKAIAILLNKGVLLIVCRRILNKVGKGLIK